MIQLREERLASEVAASLAGCPDAETLELFQGGRLDAARRSGVEQHLKTCAPCLEAVAFLERSGATEGFPQPLPSDVEERSEELLRRIGPAPARRTSSLPVLLQVAAGLALVAALAVGGFSLLGPGRAPDDLGSLRGDEPLTLLTPVEETEAPLTEMRWIASPDAARYRITVLDENLQEVWSVETAGSEPVLVPGRAEQELLSPGGRYVWRVVALDEFGATVSQSPAEQFEINPP